VDPISGEACSCALIGREQNDTLRAVAESLGEAGHDVHKKVTVPIGLLAMDGRGDKYLKEH
jgi:hypothetical protein